MDWMTLTIELVGLLILCIWIVVPITEFKEILHKIRPHLHPPEDQANARDDQE